MSLKEVLFGKPIPNDEAEEEKMGPLAGIPVLGLDALASAAYGPEAALTVLLVLGTSGSRHIGPIVAIIAALLLIVQFSYRQTIAAYPAGGGSYSVARANLGRKPALLAAAALKMLLLFRGGPQVVVISAPWFLRERKHPFTRALRFPRPSFQAPHARKPASSSS